MYIIIMYINLYAGKTMELLALGKLFPMVDKL